MDDNFQRLTEHERRKYEIAVALGLDEKLKEVGWAGLSAKESGRVGGRMNGARHKGRQ